MGERSKTIDELVLLADHYKALGFTDVPLSFYKDWESAPWEKVTYFRMGGSGRLGFNTSAVFAIQHECGLTFSWNFDLEKQEANGSRQLQLDLAKIKTVFGRLPPSIQLEVRQAIEPLLAEIERQGEEYMQHAEELFGSAATLRRVVYDATRN